MLGKCGIAPAPEYLLEMKRKEIRLEKEIQELKEKQREGNSWLSTLFILSLGAVLGHLIGVYFV